MPSTTDLEQLLRGVRPAGDPARGSPSSPPCTSHPHADTDTIIGAAREQLGEVSTQAVYDVLRALTDRRPRAPHRAGRLRRRATSRASADNHHHVVCRSCGAIADVDCAVGDAPCLTASDDHGFVIDEAEVTYWGLCPACSPHRTRSLNPSTEPLGPGRNSPCLTAMMQSSAT